MADEGFGDVLRALAQRKLHWPPARRGLGAHLQRLIELQGAQIDATLVNRWLRDEAAPPLDSLYLPALRDALGLSHDEYDRLYRALARSRGAALPMPLARPVAEPAPGVSAEPPGPHPIEEMPAPPPREWRELWLLLATAIAAAALAFALSRLLERHPGSAVPTRALIAPGGVWIAPASGFVVAGGTLHFAARAYPTSPTDPPVSAVFFTASWQAPDGGWRIACRADTITPGTPDTYECDWPLTANVPDGELTISFDVYDKAGNARKAPHGLRKGMVRR
ncbi:MAG: hypothetical protein U0232_04825 [Thermomicrobiales bacterium]